MDLKILSSHRHQHGPNCGHTAVEHEGHIDYLHDGELHHSEGHNCAAHVIAISGVNPAFCTAEHPAQGHDQAHVHGPGCGHAQIPHGDHFDYLVDGQLHHPHGTHCDNHGTVNLA